MSGEKNLPATKKKIDDARKKGQVATSKDAQIVVKLFVGYAVAMGFMGMYADQLGGFVELIASAGMTERFHWSSDLIWAGIRVFFVITFPVVAVCALAATVTTWAQIGFLVSPEAAQPSFKKLDAVQNAKQMFSKKSLLQLLLSAFKVAIVAWVAYLVFKSMMNDMVYSYRGGFGELMKMMGIVLKKIIFTTLACFIVIALIDWVIERANLMKNLRMNHQDMKEEHKQTNGNPEVIKHRKKEHRNLLNSSLNQVGQSKVVVANPTHISVALDYEPGVHDVPFVVAMGVDADALAIRREATKLGIPIIVNVKLARMIYKDCEEEEYIQREHLELAAEVFRAVFQLNQSTSQEGGDQQG